MGNMLILNGSPRAARSNSKQYAALFAGAWPGEVQSHSITRDNHLDLCARVGRCDHLLLVFPLYVDSLPVTLLHFLKTLEEHLPQHKPTVSVLINCGFLEPAQNDVAVKMIQCFCQNFGFPFGSSLKIGGGEAILTTPFRGLAHRKIRRLAAAIAAGRHRQLQVTMPLPKFLFLRASAAYWTAYGARSGITREQMATMQIEDT